MKQLSRRSIVEFARFFMASFGGVALDIAISYGLVQIAGVPLLGASSVSLLMAAGAMYFVHEHWTFGGDGHFSVRRLSSTLVSALAALFSRLIVLAIMNILLKDSWVFLQLLFAVGTSFLVNYFLVRRIMRRPSHEPTR